MLFRRFLQLLGFLIVVAAVVAWAFTLRPTFLRGPASYVTVTGRSMEPTLQSGDLVILRERDTYHEGDIVAYPIPAGEPGAGSRIIHRIVGGSGTGGYVTRGDNRATEDQWHPTDDEVLGRLWVRAPGVGRFVPELQAPLVIASVAALVTVWVVLAWKPKRRPREE